MPFGLSSAPGTFLRLMYLVFSGLNYYSMLVYLDDVVVFEPSVETLMVRLEEVLSRLRDAYLKINTRKASPSESTGYSANLLLLGREVNTPADIVYGVIEPQGMSVTMILLSPSAIV